MPSVSKEEKTKSEEFMKVIHQLLNFIEELARNDNEYLELMNGLKVLNDFKDRHNIMSNRIALNYMAHQVRNNPVVVQHNRRQNYPERTEEKTEAEKIKAGWKVCCKCERLVLDLAGHQARNICKKINKSKKLSAKTGITETGEIYTAKIKIKDALISTSKKYWLDRLGTHFK